MGVGFYQGYKNGIIYSLFSLAGWFLGIYGAMRFSYLMVHFLQGATGMSPKALAIVSFILMLLLVVGLLKLVAWALEQILKSMSLNMFNRLAGGLLHALIGLYIVCVLVWFLERADVIPASQKQHSHTYAYIYNLAPRVMEWSGKVVPLFKGTFERFENIFRPSPAA